MPKKAPAPEPEPLEVFAKSIAITGNNTLQARGTGTGGKTSSKLQKKENY